MTLRVVLFAPTPGSLYSRLLAHSIQEERDVDLVGIAVRSMWSWRRIRGELKRDGGRLVRKVYEKLWLAEHAYPVDESRTLPHLAAEMGLSESNLRRVAESAAIPFIEMPDLNAERVEVFLRDQQPDVIVFSGGGLIRENILAAPKLGILNCHSGILPAYRGMDVVEWAILEAQDDPAIGLTLHFMDQGVDTGPILLRHHEPLQQGDTLGRIRRRLEPEMVALMMEGLRGLRDRTLEPQPQAAEEGRQYFVMHPTLKQAAAEKVVRLSRRE